MASIRWKPTRLDAAKDVATQFVTGRESDNIGLVIFAGEAFTQVPMTTDNASLVNAIRDIKIGMLEDGTADVKAGDKLTVTGDIAKVNDIIGLTLDEAYVTGNEEVVLPEAKSEVARIFTNQSIVLEIFASRFSAALGNMSKLYCTHLHENSRHGRLFKQA